MGMFDSFYDAQDVEWQTKAYDCELDIYRVGDRPSREDWPASHPSTYQVEVLGGRSPDGRYVAIDSFATVTDDVLTRVPAERDPLLPLINYSGHLVEPAFRLLTAAEIHEAMGFPDLGSVNE